MFAILVAGVGIPNWRKAINPRTIAKTGVLDQFIQRVFPVVPCKGACQIHCSIGQAKDATVDEFIHEFMGWWLEQKLRPNDA